MHVIVLFMLFYFILGLYLNMHYIVLILYNYTGLSVDFPKLESHRYKRFASADS